MIIIGINVIVANFIARAVLQTRLARHALRPPLELGFTVRTEVVLHAKILFALACVWSERFEYVWPNLPTVGC